MCGCVHEREKDWELYRYKECETKEYIFHSISIIKAIVVQTFSTEKIVYLRHLNGKLQVELKLRTQNRPENNIMMTTRAQRLALAIKLRSRTKMGKEQNKQQHDAVTY